MDKWEHMVVRALTGQYQPQPQFVLTPDRSSHLVGNQAPTFDSTIALLDKLGADGWELVQVADVGDDGKTGVYWLKRRVSEPEVGEPFAFRE